MRQPYGDEQVYLTVAEQRIDFGMAAGFHGNRISQAF